MKRRLAREIAVLSLYQMEMNAVEAGEAVAVVVEEAHQDNEANMQITDEEQLKEYVIALVRQTADHKAEIDELLAKYLQGWQMDRLSRVDSQVLRLAVCEMVYRSDVPAKVAINEAIELAKHFGTEESGKFVNGVLGKMIKDIGSLKESLNK